MLPSLSLKEWLIELIVAQSVDVHHVVDLETVLLTTSMIGEDKEKDNYNF